MTVLETERLRLRPWTAAESDIQLWLDLHADSAITEFIGTYTRESATERLTGMEKQWQDRGHGQFVVESRTDGTFLGRAGLNYWEQFDEVEAAWTFRASAWGNGYATEAAKTFLPWGFEALNVPYITAMIRPHNVRSQRVADRLGFTHFRHDTLFGNPVIVNVRHRPE
ncbi:GNAT family N-acetyltransferase [Nocardia yamanashiensis]|uniref:GNAT family N-acetyltransferase n=1 Tax=Nocardia yamanashiensis TaxID=209247 RepID=UPI001E625E82|nr:GNAT family N-acetyltransferase [Nocardia yamanashiensis]UGT40275.1 GNAT family N-acetyltransferase [Nocardia yamanashiensis]